MADDPLMTALAALPRIATADTLPSSMLPEGFEKKYEILSFRNAANLLFTAHETEAKQLFSKLNAFEIHMADILEQGGNKSRVAKKLEDCLHPLGWDETRISGDLLIRTRARSINRAKKSPKYVKVNQTSILENYLDGHQIDFVKCRVAFDLEWNSKDQTFDRDLYAMRAFYDCGIIDVGIILTRSTHLSSMFADVASRIDSLKSFKSKYGASTTWMGKLDYRINAGRAGGCPILALGFKDAAFADLESWKSNNPVINANAVDDFLAEAPEEL